MSGYSLFGDIFLRVFVAIMLYYGLKDLTTGVIWPWIKSKWQARRRQAAA